MRYVQVIDDDGAMSLDPQPYLDVLPEIGPRLPQGARQFATDPEHYDFYGNRCVKDLALVREDYHVETETCTVVFAPNSFKHESGLTVNYSGVESVEVRMESSPFPNPMRFSVLLDEILPEDGGIVHEYCLRSGSVVIRAADLVAVWE
jgi:hypothetical protein